MAYLIQPSAPTYLEKLFRDGDALTNHNSYQQWFLDAANGNDSNNGRTAQTAWKTFDYSVYFLSSIKFSIDVGATTVNVAPGAYINSCISDGLPPCGAYSQVQYSGSSGNANDVTLATNYGLGFEGGQWSFANMSLTDFTGYYTSVFMGLDSILSLSNVKVIQPNSGIYDTFEMYKNTTLNLYNVEFSGASGSIMFNLQESSSVYHYGVMTLSGSPSFAPFAKLAGKSTYINRGGTFVGSATGQRHQITEFAKCFTNGTGVNLFPGNSAGSVSSTATFV